MDNFEWQKGYSMCFGLIACDRATQVRTLVPPKLVVNFKQSNVLKDKLKGLPHE